MTSLRPAPENSRLSGLAAHPVGDQAQKAQVVFQVLGGKLSSALPLGFGLTTILVNVFTEKGYLLNRQFKNSDKTMLSDSSRCFKVTQAGSGAKRSTG